MNLDDAQAPDMDPGSLSAFRIHGSLRHFTHSRCVPVMNRENSSVATSHSITPSSSEPAQPTIPATPSSNEIPIIAITLILFIICLGIYFFVVNSRKKRSIQPNDPEMARGTSTGAFATSKMSAFNSQQAIPVANPQIPAASEKILEENPFQDADEIIVISSSSR